MKAAIASLICIGAVILACPASAAIHVVRPDSTGDFPTIQAAINAVADGDTIELTNGTFAGIGNRDIDYLGKAIVVRSQSGNPDSCIIDCQRAGRGFWFHLGEGPASVLEGVTVWRGGAYGTSDYGGGIYCGDSSPHFMNCVLRENWAPRGGGLACGGSSAASWAFCTIINSSAGMGSGIYCEDNASPSFTHCTIRDNSAGNGGGGADCYDNASPTFVECTLSANRAAYGGGMSCGGNSAPRFLNCTISGNSAAWGGGGVYGASGSSPSFTQCTLSMNSTDSCGGAANFYESSPCFSQCMLLANFAKWGGGGVFCDYHSSASFVRCTFSGNTGTWYRWGVYCLHSSPSFNSTIIAFSSGPGIYFRDCAESQIEFCDLFGNTGGDIAFWNNDPSNGPPMIGQLMHTNANGDSCDAYYNIFLSPMFAAGDFHLLAESPCIDAGDPTLPLDSDGTIADIGAFYYHQLDAELPFVLLPAAHELHPNWPNPFNSTTVIRYDVPMTGKVSLTIFNLLGQRVTTLLDQRQIAGTHTIQWDATDWPSGVYLCRMEASGFVQTRKMLLVK